MWLDRPWPRWPSHVFLFCGHLLVGCGTTHLFQGRQKPTSRRACTQYVHQSGLSGMLTSHVLPAFDAYEIVAGVAMTVPESTCSFL